METRVIETNIDAEVLARNVAEEIDTTGIAREGKVIYQGTIMTRAEAAALIDQQAIESRNLGVATFDPIVAIDDNMLLGQPRMALKRNLVYGALYRVVNAARSLVFQIQSESNMPLKDFCAVLEAGIDADPISGSESYSDGVQRVAALIAIAKQWKQSLLHDASILGTQAGKMDLPTLDQIIDEKPKAADDELEKMVSVARMMVQETGGTEEEIAEAEKLARQKFAEDQKFKLHMHEQTKGAVRVVIETAMNLGLEVQFYELPVQTQAQILMSVHRSAEKLPFQLVRNTRVSVAEMALSVTGLTRVKKVLSRVLSDSRFSTALDASL